MKPLSVYVAAPFEDRDLVRVVHERLRKDGIATTASWADLTIGGQDVAWLAPERLRALAKVNDADLRSSDAVLVLADIEDGLRILGAMRDRFIDGYRGDLLIAGVAA